MSLECPAERMISLSEIRAYLQEEARESPGSPKMSFKGEIIFGLLFRLHLYSDALFALLTLVGVIWYTVANGLGNGSLTLFSVLGLSVLTLVWLGLLWTILTKPSEYLWKVFDSYCENRRYNELVHHFIEACKDGTLFIYIRENQHFLDAKPWGRRWGKPLNLLHLILFDFIPAYPSQQYNLVRSSTYLFNIDEVRQVFGVDDQPQIEQATPSTQAMESSLENAELDTTAPPTEGPSFPHEQFPGWRSVQSAILGYELEHGKVGPKGHVIRGMMWTEELGDLRDFLLACFAEGYVKENLSNRLSLAAIIALAAYRKEKLRPPSTEPKVLGSHFRDSLRELDLKSTNNSDYPSYVRWFLEIYPEEHKGMGKFGLDPQDLWDLADRADGVLAVENPVFRMLAAKFTYLVSGVSAEKL